MPMEAVDRQMPDWQCLSTEEWPRQAGAGAKLHLVDTGEVYVMFNGTWTQDLRLKHALGLIESS